VGGRNTWNRKQIVDLLRRELYVGVEYYGKTTSTSDPDTGKLLKRQKDRKEWLRREMPHLRIIDEQLWEATQSRLKECADAYSRRPRGDRSRTDVYPTVLIRPYCKCCDEPLRLGRSGKFASFYCAKGKRRKSTCSLKTYKSVKLVEESVLDHVRQVVLDDSFLERLVKAANEAIESESRRPQQSEEPLVNRLRSIQSEITRWMKGMDESGTNSTTIVRRVSELEKEAHRIENELSIIRATKSTRIRKMTSSDVADMLTDLRGLLSEDVASAAPLLRRLVGKITVENSGKKVCRSSVWIARFSINTVPVLAELAARRRCPNTSTLEILAKREWTMPLDCMVEIRQVPEIEKLAPEVLRLHQQGASRTKIASALDKSFEFVSHSLHFAETGEYLSRKRNPKKDGQKPSSRGARQTKYKDMAEQVSRLRDELGMSFHRIARDLGVALGTVKRAWDFAHQKEIMDGIHSRQPLTRTPRTSLSLEEQQRAMQLFQDGLTFMQIGKMLGRASQTIERFVKRFRPMG
jgi:DNA invertase Pin-like site-specific DNA recombinase